MFEASGLGRNFIEIVDAHSLAQISIVAQENEEVCSIADGLTRCIPLAPIVRSFVISSILLNQRAKLQAVLGAQRFRDEAIGDMLACADAVRDVIANADFEGREHDSSGNFLWERTRAGPAATAPLS